MFIMRTLMILGKINIMSGIPPLNKIETLKGTYITKTKC